FLVTQKHSILSASPELFFHRSDATILCSPIKGTRPRGVSEQQDQNLANELQDSSKDRAELAMIVDLVRNDLGRIAEIGSVQVRTHARLESLPNVHHLVSDIEATLSKQIVFSDIIRALFPSGSITGTPKIAAMELIATLEQRPRRIYTGSIGCVGPNRLATFSVAIRTGICADGTFRFSSGGAVVIDSIPDDEFEETLAKAQSLYLPYQAFYQSTETTT
ncbi:MAG: anthranilate synthase component I family protein, partial [Bdellovibrionales bacterium]|nr:anthranilate synthase component I family protein [Bdellovibrionales bacterium]